MTESTQTKLDTEAENWEKRYKDLQAFEAKRYKELTTKISQLESKVSIKPPKTEEEMQQFASEYPDLFDAMQTLTSTEVNAAIADLNRQLAELKEQKEEAQREASQERALAKIRKAHPDFDQLSQDSDFKAWGNRQPRSIQVALFESDDPESCIRAIDLYKLENAVPAATRSVNKHDAAINPRKGEPTVPTEHSGKKEWKESEIARLSEKEYNDRYEEIEQARREGRVRSGV